MVSTSMILAIVLGFIHFSLKILFFTHNFSLQDLYIPSRRVEVPCTAAASFAEAAAAGGSECCTRDG
jgi:hypothetical protein